jgi:hypothetical protein
MDCDNSVQQWTTNNNVTRLIDTTTKCMFALFSSFILLNLGKNGASTSQHNDSAIMVPNGVQNTGKLLTFSVTH